MRTDQIINKTSYNLAMKILGTTNLIKTTYLFVKWILNPQKNVELAKKLASEVKISKNQEYLIRETYPRMIAVSYLNEVYSKYLAYGKSNQEIVAINKNIDKGIKSNNNISNALIEIRKCKLEINKKIFESDKKILQNDQLVKTTRTFGVSGGIIRGIALNIVSNSQKIPINCIGIFPSAGPKYTKQFTKCVGIVFLNGGITSHGAILARESDIPAIVSPNLKISNGTNIFINGGTGELKIIGTGHQQP